MTYMKTIPRLTSYLLLMLIMAASAPFPVATAAPLAPQQAGGLVELSGQLGGIVSTIVSDGRHAFVGVGPRVAVLDLAVPGAPQLAGWSDILPAPVIDLAIADDRLIAAAGTAGLLILDIAAVPNSPRLVDRLELGGVYQVTASRDRAYTVTGSTLWVVDVTSAGRAKVAHSLDLFLGKNVGKRGQLVLAGDRLFIGYEQYGVGVVDVRVPEAAYLAGWNEDVPCWSFAVGDGFVAAWGVGPEVPGEPREDAGIQILSLDPARFLHVVGHLDTGGIFPIQTMDATRQWLFAQQNRELQAISVADLGNPVLLHRFELPPRGGVNGSTEVGFHRPRQLLSSDSGVYTIHHGGFDADHTKSGVIAIGFDEQTGLSQTGAWLADLPGDVQRAKQGGSEYLVLGEFATGILRLYRELTDGTLEALGVLPVDVMDNFAIEGSLLFLVDAGLRELRAVDIVDPRHPKTIGREIIEGLSGALAVRQSRAYVMQMVSSEAGGTVHHLEVYAVASDGRLTLTGLLPAVCRNAAEDMVVDGTRLYLACRRQGLVVVDIAEPDQPRLVAQVPIDAEAWAVFVRGDLAYVATRWPTPPEDRDKVPLPTYGGLRIVDLGSMTEVGAYRMTLSLAGNTEWDLAVVGRFAVLTTSRETLYVIDVDDPTRPDLGQALAMPSVVGEITVRGDRMYITGRGGGVYVLRWRVDPDRRVAASVYLPITWTRRRLR